MTGPIVPVRQVGLCLRRRSPITRYVLPWLMIGLYREGRGYDWNRMRFARCDVQCEEGNPVLSLGSGIVRKHASPLYRPWRAVLAHSSPQQAENGRTWGGGGPRNHDWARQALNLLKFAEGAAYGNFVRRSRRVEQGGEDGDSVLLSSSPGTASCESGRLLYTIACGYVIQLECILSLPLCTPLCKQRAQTPSHSQWFTSD